MRYFTEKMISGRELGIEEIGRDGIIRLERAAEMLGVPYQVLEEACKVGNINGPWPKRQDVKGMPDVRIYMHPLSHARHIRIADVEMLRGNQTFMEHLEKMANERLSYTERFFQGVTE